VASATDGPRRPALLVRRPGRDGTLTWFSSYGTDFNYDFHATLDGRVAPVLHFRTVAELADRPGRQEEWEEPAGRATPLGLNVGGPNMRVPDEY